MVLKLLKNISKNDLSESDKIRFFKKVRVPNDLSKCWEWIAFKDKRGYGIFSYRNLGNIKAHRISYIIHKGNFNNKKFICHHCDNPGCVNPEHLFCGTHLDNVRDKMKKGRDKKPPPHLGENHHKLKMTAEDIKNIRKMFKEGKSQTFLAKMYLLHISTMHNICRKKTWKNV